MTDPASVTEVLVAAVRDARDRDGWNARTLAEACAAVGMPSLDQSTITNILNGRRQRIGVDEWLTLAYVLAIPPAQMLLPLTKSDQARLTPSVVVSQDGALKWLLGEDAAPQPDGELRDVQRWERNGAPILRWRELWRLTSDVFDLLSERAQIQARRLPEDREQVTLALARKEHEMQANDLELQDKLRHLAEQYNYMRRLQLSPPPPSDVFLHYMDQLEVPRPKGYEA